MMIKWEAAPDLAGFIANVSSDITLVVTPCDYVKGFKLKAARGTKWRAQATHWCERTRVASRYGRDEYDNPQDSPQAAKRLAETIYNDARAERAHQ
ncbi:hypothetical protein BSL82_15705 [Tardibacter chloracetimidivorans]|uniref:Uncharacterized protein n=1 Tax=Tardibacter chloracetimidivorans TaxID=1921510 RepID=A0A1L3ZY63_9SPHN|nr:hypothetical protein [Tardibacter chloracetimidivorans]API60550.1 hypothetical protein BSL82_15705 [Tardibacter chloracetimidivorans]